jgi:hypothetical protein
MSNTNTNINPKPCNYNCGTRIYWNTSKNAYFEVFAKQKHVCPNRSKYVTQSTTNTNKATYYKKSWYNTHKPKMSNSFELLTGPITDIQKKYETLSDIVSEANGKVHGSQRDRDPKTGMIDLLVYYEVQEEKREEVKDRFNNIIRNIELTISSKKLQKDVK